jgi:ABC-type hemin transport system ATPase subunit
MPLITSLSDTILALDLGTVLVQGTPDDVLSDSRVVSAYLGTDASVIRRSSGTAPPKQQGRKAQKVGAAR